MRTVIIHINSISRSLFHPRFLDEHLGDAGDGIAQDVATATLLIILLPRQRAIAAIPDTDVSRAIAATKVTGHLHSLAHEAAGVSRDGLARDADEPLERLGQAEAETGEEGRQHAAADEGHEDEEEDLPRVALRPVDEVADETLELLV